MVTVLKMIVNKYSVFIGIVNYFTFYNLFLIKTVECVNYEIVNNKNSVNGNTKLRFRRNVKYDWQYDDKIDDIAHNNDKTKKHSFTIEDVRNLNIMMRKFSNFGNDQPQQEQRNHHNRQSVRVKSLQGDHLQNNDHLQEGQYASDIKAILWSNSDNDNHDTNGDINYNHRYHHNHQDHFHKRDQLSPNQHYNQNDQVIMNKSLNDTTDHTNTSSGNILEKSIKHFEEVSEISEKAITTGTTTGSVTTTIKGIIDDFNGRNRDRSKALMLNVTNLRNNKTDRHVKISNHNSTTIIISHDGGSNSSNGSVYDVDSQNYYQDFYRLNHLLEPISKRLFSIINKDTNLTNGGIFISNGNDTIRNVNNNHNKMAIATTIKVLDIVTKKNQSRFNDTIDVNSSNNFSIITTTTATDLIADGFNLTHDDYNHDRQLIPIQNYAYYESMLSIDEDRLRTYKLNDNEKYGVGKTKPKYITEQLSRMPVIDYDSKENENESKQYYYNFQDNRAFAVDYHGPTDSNGNNNINNDNRNTGYSAAAAALVNRTTR